MIDRASATNRNAVSALACGPTSEKFAQRGSTLRKWKRSSSPRRTIWEPVIEDAGIKIEG
jgi:hypothetical protein